MGRTPDVAVVGGGILGLGVADSLVRRGADVVLFERAEPGDGQSAGEARGFRHLHATRGQILDAVRARSAWDAWSARAGEPLVGEEGALRLGGDVAADAARLRDAGVAAEVVDVAGERHPALREDAGPLLWDPRGGAIRAARAIGWLRGQLGERVRRTEVRSLGEVRAGHVVVCAGAGTERLWPGVTMRREVHLRVTFAAPAGASYATWADRSVRFGATAYGVADGARRFALGLADHADQPAPADPAAEVVPAGVDLAAQRARVRAYAAAAFPGLGDPIDEVVRLLTILPGRDEDAYVMHTEPRLTVLAGHNLFKLAPLLAELAADSMQPGSGDTRAASG